MKKINLGILGIALLLMVSCSKEDSMPITVVTPQELMVKEPLTPQQINQKIDESIQTKGAFDWKNASDNLLWSAVHHGDNAVAIGFGTSKDDFDRSKSPQNANIQNSLVELIMSLENADRDQVLLSSDPFLNTMDVRIEKQETIIALRKSNLIRYIEPANYKYFAVANMYNRPESSGGSGCGFEASTLSASDYTTITPNAKAA